MENDVTIITRGDNCQPCNVTKRAFVKQGVGFTEKALEDCTPEELQSFADAGHAQAPVVITPDETWSGFRPDKIKQFAASQSSQSSKPERPASGTDLPWMDPRMASGAPSASASAKM